MRKLVTSADTIHHKARGLLSQVGVICPPEAAGAASLAAELFAARQRIDYIRTHDVGQLDQALKVAGHLDSFS